MGGRGFGGGEESKIKRNLTPYLREWFCRE
jgi:hypothetical protein